MSKLAKSEVSLQLNRIIDQVLDDLLFLGTGLGITRYSDKKNVVPVFMEFILFYLMVLYTKILVFSYILLWKM